jgi:glutamine amidotransferase-like protein
MCSISGFISAKPMAASEARHLAQALLYYGEPRGDKSCGLYANGKRLVGVETPIKWVLREPFLSFFDADTSICLCHTRQPTHGDVTEANAQPFICGNTIGIHNGVLGNHEEIAKKYDVPLTTDVDSELLPAALDKLGLTDFLTLIRDLNGTAACALLHKDQLYVARDGNPLCYYSVSFSNSDQTICVFGSTDAQVMTAIRSVWLLPYSERTRDTTSGNIYLLSPNGPLPSAGVFSTKTWSRSPSYSPNSNGHCGHGGPPFHSHVGPGPTRALAVTKPINPSKKLEYRDVWVNKVFTQDEIDFIRSNPDVVYPHIQLGLGFLRKHGQWVYDYQYAQMQRVKFDSCIIIEPADPSSKKWRRKSRDRNWPTRHTTFLD